MRLRAVKGLTIDEIAVEMGIEAQTVRQHLHRLHKALGARTGFHAVYLWLLAKARAK